MNATLTYPEESRLEFAWSYFFRKMGFESSIHFLKCLLLAILESL